MLTRLEVDGFKNLNGFVAEFGAFTCIAGANGVGKSNVFDAIEFIALIADRGLMDAAREVRSTKDDGAGEPRDLFHQGLPNAGPMRFCVEMIVPPEVEDYFGVTVEPAITFLRYEVAIRFELPDTAQRHGRLVVDSETLKHINLGMAGRNLGFPMSATEFRGAIVRGRRSGKAFISTEHDEHRITVHQDGGSRGRPRRALPTGANTTVVSTINSADDPTILAVRREMQSWRRLALEPTALRTPDRFTDPQVMEHDGHHLAATLHRIATTPGPEGKAHPEDVFARIASRLAGLSGLNLRAVRVDEDEARQLLTIVVIDRDGFELPARSLSEGTLRYLALCVLLEDPMLKGVTCMEEPENGIHPGNLAEMVTLVRDLAVDPLQPPGPDNPVRQVIVNTHSPAVVQLVGRGDLLLATEQLLSVHGSTPRRCLRVDGIVGSWRDGRDGRPGALEASLFDYLTPPPGAQFSLFHDVA
jgi:predicted ATPase